MNYKFDIDEIKTQVKKVIANSQDIPESYFHIDKIIDSWLLAKKYFIERLNGNLIYQSDKLVSFELDEKSRVEKLSHFAELVFIHYNNEPLSNFLYNLPTEDFYHNKTSEEFNYFDIKVPKNFKVVKAFKFFESNPDILKEIQNEASRIIQEDIVTGYLCFSVHPLDFLSASENVHNWRSCHALDGDYRSGNLNYLMDDDTVICYLKAEKEAILPHFPASVPWNSKKWRTWFHFSDDKTMLFAGRSYPFTSEVGLEYVKNIILPEIGIGEWTDFHQTMISTMIDEKTNHQFFFDKCVPVGRILKPLKELVRNGNKTYMYNDVLQSSCYNPLYAYKKEDYFFQPETGQSSSRLTVFHIGAECPCPLCGKNRIDYPNIIACKNCAEKYGLEESDYYCTCDVCGITVHEDDAYYLEFSDINVCPDCYERETSKCQACGIVDLKDKITVFRGMHLCPICQEHEKEKPERIVMPSNKQPILHLDSLTIEEKVSEDMENFEVANWGIKGF